MPLLLSISFQELSTRLGNFDRRTLEMMLSRMEKYTPPSNLADLQPVQVLETHGRERRYRFFLKAHYQALAIREGLQEEVDKENTLDGSQIGGFSSAYPAQFYTTMAQLYNYQDSYKDGPSKPSIAKGQKRKASTNDRVASDILDQSDAPKKDGRKRAKTHEPGPSTLSTSSHAENQASVSLIIPSTERDVPPIESISQPPKRKRGRPSKKSNTTSEQSKTHSTSKSSPQRDFHKETPDATSEPSVPEVSCIERPSKRRRLEPSAQGTREL